MTCAAYIALLGAEVGHDEDDCVAGEDVVPAVHERPVDREDGDHPVDDHVTRPAISVHWYPASDLGKTVTKIVIDLQRFVKI